MPAMTDIEKYKKIKARSNELETIRQPWEEIWQEAIDYGMPRMIGIQGVLDSTTTGSKTGQMMYDGTAQTAAQLFCDGLQGYSISPSFPWFKLGIPYSLPKVFPGRRAEIIKRIDTVPEVKRWLEDKEEVDYSACIRSNIYEEISSFILGGIVIGTAVMYAEEDLDKGRIMFSDRHPSEFYIAENRFSQVDTVFRQFKMTVKQIKESFPEENWSDEIKNQVREDKLDATHLVIHAVMPKIDFYGKGNYQDRPWVSIYCLKNDQIILSESGYAYFPYIVWRFKKNTLETYGRGPTIDAMVDILGLNQINKDLLQASHNATYGIWNAPEEMRGKVRINAKGINYYTDPGRELKQVAQDIKFPYGVDREERKAKTINERFNVDFFVMLANSERQMTATEIIERQGEKAAILGPVIGRLNTECFNPLIDIIDFIETRARRMPPPPEALAELAGKNIEVDFVGPLAEAQKRLFKSRGINNFMQSIIPIAQIKPSMLDNLDEDSYFQVIAEANSVPEKIIKPKEVVLRMRAEEQAKIEAMEKAKMANEAAKNVPNLNQPIEEGSPLEAMGNAMSNTEANTVQGAAIEGGV